MKRFLLIALYAFSLQLIVAQEDQEQVWRIWYMKPVQGKAEFLERGIKDHVAKNHGDGQWPEYYLSLIHI